MGGSLLRFLRFVKEQAALSLGKKVFHRDSSIGHGSTESSEAHRRQKQKKGGRAGGRLGRTAGSLGGSLFPGQHPEFVVLLLRPPLALGDLRQVLRDGLEQRRLLLLPDEELADRLEEQFRCPPIQSKTDAYINAHNK